MVPVILNDATSVPGAGPGYPGQYCDTDQYDRGDHHVQATHACENESPGHAAYYKGKTYQINY